MTDDIDRDKIAERLSAKYGAVAVSAGVTAEFWARKNQHAAHQEQPARPGRPACLPPETEPTEQPAEQPERQAAAPAGWVKLWPQIGLAAIQNGMGGVFRAWALARSLDAPGSGRVGRRALRDLLNSQDVNGRTQRRWIEQALSLGIMRETRTHYYLVSLARAAHVFGAQHVGRPALVGLAQLSRAGWRGYVWAGYLATIPEGRPMSQNAKCGITGIDARTQRNYQAGVPGAARKNFAILGRADGRDPGELSRVNGITVFVWRGQLTQRLPDSRIVPLFISKSCPRGRSRVAQKTLNQLLSSLGQEQGNGFFRLFCDGARAVKSSLRHISRSDAPPWELPGVVFEHFHDTRSAGIWRAVSVGGPAM